MSVFRTTSTPIRVYYEDTDFSGFAYHGSYLRFLERGRSELLREAGFTNKKLFESDGIVFAVRSLEIDYISPALMDDLLRAETTIARVGGASLHFEQHMFRDDQEIVSAKVRVAVLRSGKPIRIPALLREVLGGSGAAPR